MDRTVITFLPRSLLGKWSVGLSVISIVLLVVSFAVSVAVVLRNLNLESGVQPGPAVTALGLGAIAGLLAAVAAWILGLISILRSRERSILVFAVVAVCFFASVAYVLLASSL